ncbi:MAG: hypothetical protein R3C17_17770 [Planctomycetaceae bacterium]
MFALIILVMSSCSGCDLTETTASDSQIRPAGGDCEVDAGVVFAGCPSYFCVPLSRLGLTSSDEIELVNSSCECIKPSLVRYAATSTAIVDGLKLEFVAEEHTPDTLSQPLHLAIDVTLKLGGDKVRTVTIKLIHTQLVAAGEG